MVAAIILISIAVPPALTVVASWVGAHVLIVAVRHMCVEITATPDAIAVGTTTGVHSCSRAKMEQGIILPTALLLLTPSA